MLGHAGKSGGLKAIEKKVTDRRNEIDVFGNLLQQHAEEVHDLNHKINRAHVVRLRLDVLLEGQVVTLAQILKNLERDLDAGVVFHVQIDS